MRCQQKVAFTIKNNKIQKETQKKSSYKTEVATIIFARNTKQNLYMNIQNFVLLAVAYINFQKKRDQAKKKSNSMVRALHTMRIKANRAHVEFSKEILNSHHAFNYNHLSFNV